jgi:hypothetical protein
MPRDGRRGVETDRFSNPGGSESAAASRHMDNYRRQQTETFRDRRAESLRRSPPPRRFGD